VGESTQRTNRNSTSANNQGYRYTFLGEFGNVLKENTCRIHTWHKHVNNQNTRPYRPSSWSSVKSAAEHASHRWRAAPTFDKQGQRFFISRAARPCRTRCGLAAVTCQRQRTLLGPVANERVAQSTCSRTNPSGIHIFMWGKAFARWREWDGGAPMGSYETEVALIFCDDGLDPSMPCAAQSNEPCSGSGYRRCRENVGRQNGRRI
jgi:hypothetical protein